MTGAGGFIGRKLCKELHNQGAVVRLLSKSIQSGNNYKAYFFDLTKPVIPNEAFQNVDIVFHLAGKVHDFSSNKINESEYNKINVDGTRELLTHAKLNNVTKFIFFSSVKAMGEGSNYCADELSEPIPTTQYGISKLEAEKLVLQGGYIPHPTVLRLSMVYGSSNKGNLPRLVKLISKLWFIPFPTVNNKRSMVHVNDVVDAAILTAITNKSSGQIFIISDGREYSTRQIYELICTSLGKKAPRWGIPLLFLKFISLLGDLVNYISGKRISIDSENFEKLFGSSIYSNKKAVKELGFSPKHNLENSIKEIISVAKWN